MNNGTYTSHSREKFFVWKHEHEAKDVKSTVIQI